MSSIDHMAAPASSPSDSIRGVVRIDVYRPKPGVDQEFRVLVPLVELALEIPNL